MWHGGLPRIHHRAGAQAVNLIKVETSATYPVPIDRFVARFCPLIPRYRAAGRPPAQRTATDLLFHHLSSSCVFFYTELNSTIHGYSAQRWKGRKRLGFATNATHRVPHPRFLRTVPYASRQYLVKFVLSCSRALSIHVYCRIVQTGL